MCLSCKQSCYSDCHSTENRFCHSTRVEGLHKSCRLVQGAGGCHRAFYFHFNFNLAWTACRFDIIVLIVPTSRSLRAEPLLIVAFKACKVFTLPPKTSCISGNDDASQFRLEWILPIRPCKKGGSVPEGSSCWSCTFLSNTGPTITSIRSLHHRALV